MEEKELIEYIAKSLAGNPDEVNVRVIDGERSVIIELKVSEDDIARIIGKGGRVAKAMRTLLHAVNSKSGKHAVLEILD